MHCSRDVAAVYFGRSWRDFFFFAGMMRKGKGGRRSLDGAQAHVATAGRRDWTRRRAHDAWPQEPDGDAPGDNFFFFLRKGCAQKSSQRFTKQRSHLRAALRYCSTRIHKAKPAGSVSLREGGGCKKEIQGCRTCREEFAREVGFCSTGIILQLKDISGGCNQNGNIS